VTLVVFVGPTLPRTEAAKILRATYLPPAAQGDVLRVGRERPFAIGIIDGYFERMPAVWHKEILWAMAEGIHVFGAASMGALRAAELDAFGMCGVGAVFEAYRSGALEDDDEVAVAHGNASTGYRLASEAMVNIRATLGAAEREGVVAPELRRRMEAWAKELFYPDRSYARILALALQEGVSREEVDRLREYISAKRVDRKRADAIAMLEAMKECRRQGLPAARPAFSLAHTAVWDDLVRWAEGQPSLLPSAARLRPSRAGAGERVPRAARSARARKRSARGKHS
jgi:hypothetical protein